MSTLAIEVNVTIKDVDVNDEYLTVHLMDGRVISTPLAWYPRLMNAEQVEREKWAICGAGHGLHWENLDEDRSVFGMIRAKN